MTTLLSGKPVDDHIIILQNPFCLQNSHFSILYMTTLLFFKPEDDHTFMCCHLHISFIWVIWIWIQIQLELDLENFAFWNVAAVQCSAVHCSVYPH